MVKFTYFLIDTFLKLSRKLFRGTGIQLLPFVTSFYKDLMKYRTSGQGENFKVIFRDSAFLCQPGDITILPTLMDGTFEKIELDIFENILLENPASTVFIDVGANIGIWSILAAEAMAESSTVFAFEPDQNNLKRLLDNVSINELRNVTVVPKAVGKDGQIQFSMAEFGGVSSISLQGNRNSVLVDSVKLDTFFKSLKFASENVIIKIDVEGFEPTVLRGSLELIFSKKPILFIEIDFNENRRQLDDWGDLMKKLFSTYNSAYLVSAGQCSSVTSQDIPRISELNVLSTLIFSPQKLAGVEVSI